MLVVSDPINENFANGYSMKLVCTSLSGVKMPLCECIDDKEYPNVSCGEFLISLYWQTILRNQWQGYAAVKNLQIKKQPDNYQVI